MRRALLLAVILSRALLAAEPRSEALPFFFVPNRGQAPEGVRYMTKGSGLTVHLLASRVELRVAGRTVSLEFEGASREASIDSGPALPGRANFLFGSPAEWRTDIPLYDTVAYRDLYPGIDLRYAGAGRNLKSEFLVAPGADPTRIRMHYAGAEAPRLDSDGSLVVPVAGLELRERAPEIYQESAAGREMVEGRFVLLGGGSVGFVLGKYDAARPLIVDPVLAYSTLFGGSGSEGALGLAVDSTGAAYIAGFTDSLNLPATNPAQSFSGGGNDVFVAKLSPGGNSLVYCTYLGGTADDRASAIAVDSLGSVYITGSTTSRNFPVYAALQSKLAGYRNAFVSKLSPAGNALVYSTYLGGNAADTAYGIAVDPSGAAYVAGDTTSFSFPATGFQRGIRGGQDAFVAKFSADGSRLIYSTYLGGSGEDHGAAIAVDSAGAAWVAGATASSDFPVLNAVQRNNGGGQDAFVVRLSADGTALMFGTYLGGSGGTVMYPEIAQSVALDLNGNGYLAGVTSSPDFPLMAALQTGRRGPLDAFVARFSPAGSLVYSTYLGGSSVDVANAVAVDAAGAAYVAGYTISSDLPVANSLQSSNAGDYDAFLARLSPAGDVVQFLSYLGGNGSDSATAVALDPAANAYVAGYTLSSNFPLSHAFQSSNAGNYGAFVTKVDFTGLRTSAVLSAAVTRNGTFIQGAPAGYTVTVSNQAGAPATIGAVTVSDTLPSGLTLTSMAGSGWTCAANSCTRSDPLPGGASYPPVTVAVDVGLAAGSPQTNSIAVSGGGAAPAVVNDVTPVTILPLWGISSTHSGSWLQGQSAAYSIHVWNLAAGGPSTGTVTVTETIPTGLVLVSMTGAGWTCAANSCTRADSLAGGASYPIISVNVAIPLNASTPLVNRVAVSGGSGATQSASDSTDIAAVPVLLIQSAHGGGFTQGQTGTYTLTVGNQEGAGTSSGTVTVTESFTAGLALISMTGAGWTCVNATCTRADALGAGASYPAITVTVAVAANAATPQTNSPTVSGGGSATAICHDATAIALRPVLSIGIARGGSFTPGQPGSYTLTISNQAGGGPTAGPVTVTESLPAGLTLSSMTGAGWACATNACARNDALDAGASYPAITVGVNVAANATFPLVSTVTVTGGGSIPFTALDSTTLSCTYQLAGGNTFPPLAGNGSLTLTSTTGCTWTASAGASWLHITSAASGTGSAQISFSLDANGTASQRTATLTVGDSSLTIYQGGTVIQAGAGLRFVPATPCRIADTRIGTGPYGGPAIGLTPREFAVAASACGIPAAAQAYALNLTVVPIGALDALYVWPSGQAQPAVPNLSSTDGRVKADMAIIAAGAGSSISVAASQTTHVIVDINGYFVPASGSSDLAFYPVTPCRLVDTRVGTGPLAGPAIAASQIRTFPVLASSCAVPAEARAYALNVTVVPSSAFGFLSIWPAGNPQPVVSTLNAPTGAVTANAAIVPSGEGGAISVIASHNTALILDINGYFAPPGPGGLQFYAQTPCRIVDTRQGAGPFGGPQMSASSRRDFLVTASACGVPLTAAAYSLNASVLPPAALGFLSLWGAGGQPTVSTLNAADGATILNSALVPAGIGGTISAFTSNPTHLLLDINGYFAP